ncbi:unnamed protein product [Cylicocyclus nassatus]|uniref:Uncharacterized protein n=1 Tax=Cylicocyclus nassatus TaxID=53992 RepID=A0AA36GJ88_CYLNA|nr:unnamed protein product [Cylicocyclus nassatus]
MRVLPNCTGLLGCFQCSMKAIARAAVAIFALFASTINIYMLVRIYESQARDLRALTSVDYVQLHDNLVTLDQAELLSEGGQLRRSRNITQETMPWSGLLDFFPDLAGTPSKTLEPILLTPRSRVRKKLIIGIPVAERNKDYSIFTLTSLFSKLDEKYKKDIVFLVMFATANQQFVESRTEAIRANFTKEIDDELLEVIAVPPLWYTTDIAAVPATFNDSTNRMFWRTKQNIDYIYIMTYATPRCEYYMQLEDDVEAAAAYARVIFNYIAIKEDTDWFVMSFTSMGFIGKLFSVDNLKYVTYAIALYYRFKPVDWILEDVLRSRYCSLDKSFKDCVQMISSHAINSGASQFQHVGKVSSLSGKVQKIRDSNFNKGLARGKRPNPPAVVKTSMKATGRHDAQRGYNLNFAMWFTDPNEGSYISIVFEKPVNVTGIMFLSGVPPAPEDKLGPETIVIANSGKQEINLGRFSPDGDFLFRSRGLNISELSINITSNIRHWVVIDHIIIDTIPESNSTVTKE